MIVSNPGKYIGIKEVKCPLAYEWECVAAESFVPHECSISSSSLVNRVIVASNILCRRSSCDSLTKDEEPEEEPPRVYVRASASRSDDGW